MHYSEKNIELLKMLHQLLNKTFKGASFGSLKVDDMADALSRAIEYIEHNTKE